MPATRQLLLRPGVATTRRDAGEVQVGLDAPGRAILPDDDVVHQLLSAVRAGSAPPVSSTAQALLASLEAADLLVDAEDLTRDRSRHGAAALSAYARTGRAAARDLARRRGSRVRLVPLGFDLSPVADLLTRAGVQVSTAGAAPDADICVVAASGPLPRASLDPLLRSGIPHLVLEGDRGRLRIGPFVVPGRTACLRCVDAHESEHDPRRPFLVEQLAASPDVAVDPDPVLAALATAMIAHELVAVAEGRAPGTWSATLVLGEDPLGVPRLWRRHPECGCAWDLVERAEGPDPDAGRP